MTGGVHIADFVRRPRHVEPWCERRSGASLYWLSGDPRLMVASTFARQIAEVAAPETVPGEAPQRFRSL